MDKKPTIALIVFKPTKEASLTNSAFSSIVSLMKKKRVILILEENKIKELKKKAIDAGLTLSNFLSHAGSIVKLSETDLLK